MRLTGPALSLRCTQQRTLSRAQVNMMPTSQRVKGTAMWLARTQRATPLTLDAIARKGVASKSYLSGIERGKRDCSLDVARAIAKVLGKPVADLFDPVEKPPRWVQELDEAVAGQDA
jgi:transcriptional regulator with XRE-family HTH domain